jgi:hypothetical protein
MSTGNHYNVIVDGSLLVSKSAIVNGQLTSSNLKSLGDVISSSYSLNTLGNIIKPSPIDSNTNYGMQTLNINYNNGSYNSCVGYNSMYSNTSGSYNSVLGYKSLYSNTEGSYNTALGYNVLYSNTEGRYNTALGYNVLYSNTSGTNNIGVGSTTMYNNTSGYDNIGIGTNSLFFNKSGFKNIGIGTKALYNNTNGSSNIGIGYNTLLNANNGITNIAIGDNSLGGTSTNNINNNIAIGYNTLYNNQTTDNIAIGVSSLYSNNTGSQNIALGSGVLNKNTTGSYNIGLGHNSLNKVVSGNRNIGLGATTLKNNVSDDNIAIGYGGLFTNSSGLRNIAIGTNSLYSNASGLYNIGIGYEALKNNTYGNTNIAIGYQANTNTTNMSTISIGTNVTPSANNQLVIGNGGYDANINVSSLCIGKNNYSTSNYYTLINGSTNISGDVKINGNNLTVGTTTTNTSFIASTFNLSVPKIGYGTTAPTGTLHIYESVGSGDLSTFTFNTLKGNPNGSIYAIAIDSNNNVYVGGRFTSINGVSANNIAKWTNSTSSWSAMGTGVTDSENSATATNIMVYALAVDSNNDLYVGGRFDKANGTTVNNIAKYTSSTSTWSSMGSPVGVRDSGDNASNSYVYAIAINSLNNVFFVGKFDIINNSVTVNNVTRWNNTNSTLNGVGPGASSFGVTATAVYAIAINSNNDIFIGGQITSVFTGLSVTTPVSNIAFIGAGLTSWSGVGTSGITGGTPTVYALNVDSSNNIYVGGSFTSAGGITANNIAKWSGTAWSSIIYNSNNGTNGTIYTIDVDNNNNVYIGGNFTTAGGVTVNNIAKLNSTNTLWTPYIYDDNIGIIGETGTIPIRCISFRNNINYVGGDFTNVLGKTTINYLTYFNTIYSYYNNVSYNTSNGSQSIGTLILEHGDIGGCSSIIFPSAKDKGNDYAYIQYRDNVNDGTSTHYGRLEIGTENDYTTDALILQKNGGYVGIGTNTPEYTLDVNGQIRVGNSDSTWGMIKLSPQTNNGEASIGFYQNSNVTGSKWAIGIGGTTLGNNKFGIASSTLGGVPFTIDNNGYVGIGTTNPTGLLHIYEPTGSGDSYNLTTKGSAIQGSLIIEHGDIGGKSSVIFPSKMNRGSDYGYIIYRDSKTDLTSDEFSRLEIGTENDAGTDSNSNDALILQKNGGYVGIGTTSPNAKLHVNGTVLLTNTTGTDIEINPIKSTSGSNGVIDTIVTNCLINAGWKNGYGLKLAWNRKTGDGKLSYCCNGQGANNTTIAHEFLMTNNNDTSNNVVSAKVEASSFNATSDYRIKENIKKINDTSYNEFFSQLNPLYYFNTHKGQNDFGFIAHEVQQLYPELVDGIKDGSSFQVLNYSGIIPLCVNEIQKQNKEIQKQNQIIEELKEENKQIKTELQEIRSILNSLISQNK